MFVCLFVLFCLAALGGKSDSMIIAEDNTSLRERLRTHKVFTKDKIVHVVGFFFLDYHKFSIKSFVLDVY